MLDVTISFPSKFLVPDLALLPARKLLCNFCKVFLVSTFEKLLRINQWNKKQSALRHRNNDIFNGFIFRIRENPIK